MTFGPHRSVSRDEVEEQLEKLFEIVRRSESSLKGVEEDFELSVIRLAVWAHAEFIRIHPFEDGNGRIGRLIAGHILVRHGLRAVPIEAVKQDYTEALNLIYTSRDIGPLVDLYIRLYPVDR